LWFSAQYRATHSNVATADGVFKGYLLSSTGGRHEAIHVRRIHSNGGFGRYRWARRYHPGRHGCASAACAGWLLIPSHLDRLKLRPLIRDDLAQGILHLPQEQIMPGQSTLPLHALQGLAGELFAEGVLISV
jgi:hypothetical protein